jgi:hypothetical protein
MNIAILANTGNSNLKLVGDVLILTVGEDRIVPNDTPNEFMESFASTIISEIKRIKETSLEHARNFIDSSTFDEILACLRAGKSHICELNPAFLAQIFCHISTN